MADTAYAGAVLLTLARLEAKVDRVLASSGCVAQAQEGGPRGQN